VRSSIDYRGINETTKLYSFAATVAQSRITAPKFYAELSCARALTLYFRQKGRLRAFASLA
jgi:hypothetical protein